MDRWCMIVAAMLGLATVAQATERSLPMRLDPELLPVRDDSDRPSLKLTLYEVIVDKAQGKSSRGAVRHRQAGTPALPLDGYAAVCFETDTDGYVTLWESSATDGGATLLLPNDLSVRDVPGSDRAHPVRAGEETCVGDGEWAFRVDGPAGSRHIYAHWTASRENAVPANAYATLGRNAGGERVQRVLRTGYKAELRYQVVVTGDRP